MCILVVGESFEISIVEHFGLGLKPFVGQFTAVVIGAVIFVFPLHEERRPDESVMVHTGIDLDYLQFPAALFLVVIFFIEPFDPSERLCVAP
jgi:hypothetical protein